MLVVVATALLATGCVGSQSPEERAAACQRLADDVSGLDLSGLPDADDVEATANALDPRLSELRDPSAHEAAVDLHSSLHALARALKRGDTEHANEVADEARKAARDAADACDLDPASFGL
ncbi:MAG TPA: hypothetical protein VFJ98_03345 [Mycobacteriales bacterium]|nr:hypothetical protein [Mycobacteriales bacterium]